MSSEQPSQMLALRRLRYRLNRQGMLELEAWLARVEPALDHATPELIEAVEALLEMESMELVAMMHGEVALPGVLRPWFSERC